MRRLRRGDAVLLLADELADGAVGPALDRPWELLEGPPGPGRTGRGPRAVATLPGGLRVLVKQYLRGGALARFNRERYFAVGRFAREIEAGARARAAGLPVGETLGVLLAPARPGWRAWGFARFVEAAPDLVAWFERLPPERVATLWAAALALVDRCHAAGLEHADLNLGNLLARERDDGGFEPFVVDLDRAVFHGGPVPPAARRRVTERLERSRRKLFGRAAEAAPAIR